jgi:hypothetical protein
MANGSSLDTSRVRADAPLLTTLESPAKGPQRQIPIKSIEILWFAPRSVKVLVSRQKQCAQEKPVDIVSIKSIELLDIDADLACDQAKIPLKKDFTPKHG